MILSIFVHQRVRVWPWSNWGDKPKPIDGNWSSWFAWSSCQIPSDGNLLPFRHRERDCSQDRKNDGADCVGETRRTSGCDAGNIPLGMECGRIQDSFVTALQSGLWLFFFCSRFLFIYVDLELFFCLSLVFVSNSGFVLRLLLVYSVFLGFVSHFNV